VYAAHLIPEVGNDPMAIDDAMKLGYNWIKGPFELIDEIGAEQFVQRLESEQRDVPPYLKLLLANGDDARCYRVEKGVYQRRLWQSETALGWQDVDRGAGVARLTELRNTLKKSNENESAFERPGGA